MVFYNRRIPLFCNVTLDTFFISLFVTILKLLIHIVIFIFGHGRKVR